MYSDNLLRAYTKHYGSQFSNGEEGVRSFFDADPENAKQAAEYLYTNQYSNLVERPDLDSFMGSEGSGGDEPGWINNLGRGIAQRTFEVGANFLETAHTIDRAILGEEAVRENATARMRDWLDKKAEKQGYEPTLDWETIKEDPTFVNVVCLLYTSPSPRDS